MAITNGPNLGLAVNGAQGDQHFTQLMAQWRGLDGLVQPHVKSRTTTSQPASPTDGDCYIIPSGATGTNWSGQTNKIGRYTSVTPGWEFYTPKKGWRANVEDEGVPYSYSGSYWLPEESIAKIDGLNLVYGSGTSLTVSTGIAYVPGAGGMVPVTTALTLTGLTLTASTWYHVYLYLNAGVAAIECVTTAPAAPYYGSSRTKTGDTSRRYLGSVLTDASGNIYNFRMRLGNSVDWKTSIAPAPFLVVSAGRATTPTDVSCAAAVPITASDATLILANNSNTASDAPMGTSDMTGTLSATNYLQYIAQGVQTTHVMPLDSAQKFNYFLTGSTPTTGGFFARVCGYVFER